MIAIAHLALALLSLAIIAAAKPYPTGTALVFHVVFIACLAEYVWRMRRQGWLRLTVGELRSRLARHGAPQGLVLEAITFTLAAIATTVLSIP